MLCATLKPEFLAFDLVAVFTWLKAIHCIIHLSAEHEWRKNNREWLVGNLTFKAGFIDNLSDDLLVRKAIHDEVDDSHLELNHVTLDIGEASASNFRSALFINPATSLADFVVILRSKLELCWISANLSDLVIVFSKADRNVVFIDVWNLFELSNKILLNLSKLWLNLC